jgi:hypothetical protein
MSNSGLSKSRRTPTDTMTAVTSGRSRHCAYRLAELYAQAGRARDCVKMLKWLEDDDDTFKVEKEG